MDFAPTAPFFFLLANERWRPMELFRFVPHFIWSLKLWIPTDCLSFLLRLGTLLWKKNRTNNFKATRFDRLWSRIAFHWCLRVKFFEFHMNYGNKTPSCNWNAYKLEVGDCKKTWMLHFPTLKKQHIIWKLFCCFAVFGVSHKTILGKFYLNRSCDVMFTVIWYWEVSAVTFTASDSRYSSFYSN